VTNKLAPGLQGEVKRSENKDVEKTKDAQRRERSEEARK
jgi:hypothetical protein